MYFSHCVHLVVNSLEKVTVQNERISEELKFKEQKVHSLQKRFAFVLFPHNVQQ